MHCWVSRTRSMITFSLTSKPLEPRPPSVAHPANTPSNSPATDSRLDACMGPPVSEWRGRDQNVEEAPLGRGALGELVGDLRHRVVEPLLDCRQLLGVDVEVVIAQIG